MNTYMPNYKQSSGLAASIITLFAWILAIGSAIEIYYIFAHERDFLAGTVGIVVRDQDAISMLKFYIPIFLVSVGVATQQMLVPIVAILGLTLLISMHGNDYQIKSAKGFKTSKLPKVDRSVVSQTANTVSDSDMTLDDIKNASAAAIYAQANGYKQIRPLTQAEISWCNSTQRNDEHTIINCKSKHKWSKT